MFIRKLFIVDQYDKLIEEFSHTFQIANITYSWGSTVAQW